MKKIVKITVSTTYNKNQTRYLLKQIGGVEGKSRIQIGREIGEHLRSLINILKSGTLVLSQGGITHQVVAPPVPDRELTEEEKKAKKVLDKRRESRKLVGAPPKIKFTEDQMANFKSELELASARMRKKIDKRFEPNRESIHIRSEMKEELEKMKHAK